MKECIYKDNGYNVIYQEYETNVGVCKELVRYELTGSSRLYLVRATYAKRLVPNKYYVVASSLREAKSKFKRVVSWLDIIESITQIEEDDEVSLLLGNPSKIFLI